MFTPKQARIGVIKYEDMAMLSHNMQLVYIDEDWVVKEYLRCVKEKDWDKEQAWGYKQAIELEKKIYY